MSNSMQSAASLESADQIAKSVETGARGTFGTAGRILFFVALAWSVFQLYIASDIPFILSRNLGFSLVFNGQDSRQIHLAFALFIASVAYPLARSSSDTRIPWYDWTIAVVSALACLYLLVFKNAIALRAGLPTQADLIVSVVGLACLAIAVYRTLGLPLLLIASVFTVYVFFGDSELLPDVARWKGASFDKAMWHFWMQTEGVFGVGLGVSTSMIFLFVLFGSLLEAAGAGNYFIKLAFSLLGHFRGGPAKASVVASAFTGLYSGSSIANVVTTGTFTIPLMKKTGFSPEKSGAVEVAASTNGQLMPPVMGAAAFLIAEFTGISYTELIKHALLPATISYIALLYIVHIEALKLGLKGLPRPSVARSLTRRLGGVLLGFLFMAVLSFAVYYGFGWVKVALPEYSLQIAIIAVSAAYLWTVALAANRPDLEIQTDGKSIEVLQRPSEVAVTGLYYILPVVILIWCILVERLSPNLSAYWATLAMIVIAITHQPLKSWFRKDSALIDAFKHGWNRFLFGMASGARNMVTIAVATGVAGIIVGTVSLTGAHQVIGELVEYLSGGNLMVMLGLIAVMSLILGMGLPTTANYIVVSSLMVPVVVSVGAQSGLIVPLVAVHLFVFYFGILADDTPPVGLAAYAAAAISGGDPIRTGIQGFAYDIRTALLPFLFIFNTELLLIDVTPLRAAVVFCLATLAMLIFAAATQGYFLARSRKWETAILLVAAFTLFRPGFWLDLVQPPFETMPGYAAVELAEGAKTGDGLRLIVSGPDFMNPDSIDEVTVFVRLHEHGRQGLERLNSGGLDLKESGSSLIVQQPLPGTALFQNLKSFDFYSDMPVRIKAVEIPAARWPKDIFLIPAFLLIGVVALSQRRRQIVPAFWQGRGV